MMKDLRPESIRVRRRIERLVNGPEVGLRTYLKFNGQEDEVEVEMKNFSSTGALVKLPVDIQEPGVIDHLRIQLGFKTLGRVTRLLPVRWNGESQELGLEFRDYIPSEGIRRNKRMRLRQDHPLKAQLFTRDPFYPGDHLYFHIPDVSIGGMLLECSLRNRYLVPEMILSNSKILFPGLEFEELQLIIRHIAVVGERLHLGIEFQNASAKTKEGVARLALLLHDYPLEAELESVLDKLNESGLKTKNLSKIAKVDIVTTPEDYQAVLEVRLKAFLLAGKVTEGTTIWDMSDIYDQRSIIFCLRLNGRIMATIRLVRCLTPDDRFPFEEYFELSDLDFERRRKAGESSRMATDPSTKGSDLPGALLTRLFDFALRAQFEEIFGIATDSIRPIYKGLGFRDTKRRVPHPVLTGATLGLVIGKTKNLILSNKMPALVWDKLCKEVVDYHNLMGVTAYRPNSIWHLLKKLYELPLYLLSQKLRSRKKKLVATAKR